MHSNECRSSFWLLSTRLWDYVIAPFRSVVCVLAWWKNGNWSSFENDKRSADSSVQECWYANYYAPAPGPGALSDDARLTSVSLSVTYIGPKSITEKPRKTKIGTKVAHVTRDSDTTFRGQKVKGQLAGGGAYCGGLPHRLLLMSSSSSSSSWSWSSWWLSLALMKWRVYNAGAVGRSRQSDAAGAAAQQSQEVRLRWRLVHQTCQLCRCSRLRCRTARRSHSAQRLLHDPHTIPRPTTVHKCYYKPSLSSYYHISPAPLA